MSLLRAARSVTSPSGDTWDIYVSKTALPKWKDTDSSSASFGGYDWSIVDLPLSVLAALWSLVAPLARIIVLLPIAVVRGHRSRAVRIEAVNTFPQKQVLLWTTTDVHAARVLDEIAAGFAEGKVAHPDGAFYYGSEDS